MSVPAVDIGTITGGVVNFGGAVFISPKSSIKTTTGSGGDNTGVQVNTVNGVSSSNTVSSSVADQPIVRDN